MNAVDKVLYFSTRRAQERGWKGITGFISSILVHATNICLVVILMIALLVKAGVLSPINLDDRTLPVLGFLMVGLILYVASSGYSTIMDEGDTIVRSSPYSTISKWTAGRGLIIVVAAMIILL